MIDASQRDIGSCRGLNGHGLSARHFHDLVVSTGIDRDHITILCSVKRSLNRCIRIGADMDGISRIHLHSINIDCLILFVINQIRSNLTGIGRIVKRN